ncbi:hypothetical protein B0I35DRAFT_481580 [Stachybotrys elegans]|uniref:Uncharacterized protein n=1 Tax=Stachybotrys elegans TaxID=80388 RepID=A0A8K0SR40_9HYPO|nr:hypothetical protein B0I35DRAFT_481580 [Stachybotrys elegans]
MSASRGSSSSRIIVGVLATLGAIWFFGYPSTSSTNPAIKSPAMATDPISNLHLSLSQTSTSPPTIQVAVTNKNDGPITVTTYDTPLDPLAAQLGLLSITPAGAAAPLELNTIYVRRQWPPPEDCFITIEPGKTATNDLVLKEPVIPLDTIGDKATVKLAGRWEAVWQATKEAVNVPARHDLATLSEVSSGDFASDSLEVKLV